LSGLHFSLYRESGGRIEIPPQRAPESDYGTATQPLHAILATLFAPSWPAPWVERALGPRREFQFRERTVDFGKFPYPPGNGGVSQLTTFMNGNIALGSRNRDPEGMNDQTRDVVAHAAGTGGVGVFRLRIDPRPPGQRPTRLVAVQQRRSIAATVLIDVHNPSIAKSLTLTFEWAGTASSPPRMLSPPGFDRTAVVSWMDTRMRIAFALPPGTPRAGERLAVKRPDRETLQIVWSGALPRQPVAPDGFTSRSAVLFGFALHLEDRSAQLAVPPSPLAPIALQPERGGAWFRSTWSSPDGLLAAHFEIDRRWARPNVESVNRHAIPPAPIQETLPKT
jgi:hypothetical protein